MTVWIKAHDNIEAKLKEGGELIKIRDIASKAADNIARMAALFHLLETGPYGDIAPAHVTAAAQIVNWHLKESQRFFGNMVLSDEQKQLAKLDGWLVAHATEKGQSVRKTDVLQKGPKAARQKKALEAMLSQLAKMNRLHLYHQDRTNLIEINPALPGEESG